MSTLLGAASLITTTPTQLALFGQEDGKHESDAGADSTEGAGNSEGSKGTIQPKEFFWDQFLVYVSTIVALLTILDVTLQFFRGGRLMCRVPATLSVCNEMIEVTRDEVAYVNTFCQQSLSRAEYYPLFVIIQGLVLAAPQYLWASLFAGQFDFYFGLVQQLDRLRSGETGDYRTKNFEIVNKLEKQFPRKWKWVSIFSFYIAKLILQLIVVVVALFINGFVFEKRYFSFSFTCPNDLDDPGWWLPVNVTCAFTSFRLHQQLQRVNNFLLCLAFIVIVYGLIWCAKRHVNALGFKEVALFSFSSCLSAGAFVNEHFIKKPFQPAVRNDMDFLLMRLFRADSGHGLVFKDIQVERELRKREERDHELLHLYVEASKDRDSRVQDLRKVFKESGFDSDPEYEVFDTLSEHALGNISWDSIHTPTIRNIIFGFLQYVENNNFAMDISFGSSGYSLILARAFKDVLSLNFHPYFSNEDKIYHRQQFHADYCTFRFPENIFTKATTKLNKLEEALSEEFEGPYPDNPHCRKQVNFVIVNAFTDDAKIATVNLFLERQKNACRFAKHCLLMYLRPVQIGPRVVNDFCHYTPPSDLFEKSSQSDYLKEKDFENLAQKKDPITGSSAPPPGSHPGSSASPPGSSVPPSGSSASLPGSSAPLPGSSAPLPGSSAPLPGSSAPLPGSSASLPGSSAPPPVSISISEDHIIKASAMCNKTYCHFEITIFVYKGITERPPNLPPGASPYVPARESSQAGNIALIIPSQMLPELERDNIRKFMDGHMAIKLQARVPGSPIQFILPAGDHEEMPNNNNATAGN